MKRKKLETITRILNIVKTLIVFNTHKIINKKLRGLMLFAYV